MQERSSPSSIHLIALAQRLQLYELVVIASFLQKVVVCARLAHFALLDEVAVLQRMKYEQRVFKNPGNGTNTTYIRSAFWMVDNRCAMAIVVLPFAAWSRAACTTFSEFESNADVAWFLKSSMSKLIARYTVHVPHPVTAPWGSEAEHGQ